MPATAKKYSPTKTRNTALSAQVKKLRALRKRYSGSAQTSVSFTLNGELESLLFNELGERDFLKLTSGKYSRNYRLDDWLRRKIGRRI
jgi:hypothetical protein